MRQKDRINEAKVIYDIEISSILNDVNRWKSFLDFSSEFYKYSFTENLLMFAQKPSVTMCATMEQWNSVGRWVNRGAKAIRIINNQENEISLKYVFDVTDTHGDAKVLFRRWKSDEKQIIDILKNYFKYQECKTLEDIITRYVYENFDNNSIIKGLSEEELDILTPDFLENSIKYLIYNVAKRCNIKVDEENIFNGFSKIQSPLQLQLIGVIQNSFSNEILRIIEYKIRQNNREVKRNGEIRQIWNENQKEYGGELSVQIPTVSDGRNNNGEIISKGTGDNNKETQNRGGIERKISETTDERISSDSKIQSNDRGNDRGDITERNRGENLEVEKSTSFIISTSKVSEENKDIQLDLFNQSLDIREQKEEIKIKNNEEIFVAKDDIVIKEQERINYKISNDFVKHQNLKTKYQENIDAIKLLKEIESENRLATKKEQEILAKYNGWGGLAKVFDRNAKDWEEQYKEVLNVLTEDEYISAKSSVVNAFYTDKKIIDSIYLGLAKIGFENGNILEPSAGIGNFIGRLPENFKNSKFTAIEIDGI